MTRGPSYETWSMTLEHSGSRHRLCSHGVQRVGPCRGSCRYSLYTCTGWAENARCAAHDGLCLGHSWRRIPSIVMHFCS